ncbi:MAG: ABC transporter ATP-binding protein [Clostridia bacterium]|nr:ABC transporter ATP-binding protein [Clostridia bacterium]
MSNTPKTKKSASTLATLFKVLKYLKHYKWLVLLSLNLALVAVTRSLYFPVMLGKAMDIIIEAGRVDFDALRPMLVRAVVIVIVTTFAQWLMNVCNNRITFGIARRLRRDAFEHIQRLPLSYLDRHPVGDTVNRVVSDVDQFTDGLLMGFSQFFMGISTILGTLVFMIKINAPLALWVVVITPLSLFVASFIAKRTFALSQKQSETRAEQAAYIDEMIGNHKVVAAFSREDECLAEFDEINGRLGDCSRRATFFSSLTNPSTRFVNNLVYAGVALIGALMSVATGGVSLTVGQLTTFLTYANQYTKPFNEISGVIAELQNALACAARLFELMDAPAETPDAPDAAVLSHGDVDGKVVLRDVEFSYTPDRELIKDLNLELCEGQRVAIVGPTGCGKTTVINLLMRFYDVDGGSIEVSGHNVKDITRHSLRSSYGMVLQDTWLKNATVRENIAMGREDATDEEIIAAAKAAHADGFIRRLPNGYDTVLGEGGGSLSQGQKQLLCIARVFLALPPMLILDEATSSIDTRTELKIQNAFAALMKGRTSFIVAHRLSTIREADVILVMNNGRIEEQGTHDELLAHGGFYSKLYKSQFEG